MGLKTRRGPTSRQRKFGSKTFHLVYRGYRGEKRGKSQAETLARLLRARGYETRVCKMGIDFDGERGDYGVYAYPEVPIEVKFGVPPLK